MTSVAVACDIFISYPPPRSPSFSNLVCAPRKFVNIQGNSTFHKAKKRKLNVIQSKIKFCIITKDYAISASRIY